MSLRLDSSYPPAIGSTYYSQYVYGQLNTAVDRLNSLEHCLNDAGMQPVAKIATASRLLNEAKGYISKDHEQKSELFLECQQRYEALKEAIDNLKNIST